MTASTILLLLLTATPSPKWDDDVAPLLKRHCVKCHGPIKAEARLNLSTRAGLLRGGENGSVAAPHDLEASSLWKRVSTDEMPPEEPLSLEEKEILRTWIEAGTPGLPTADQFKATGGEHWAFQKLVAPPIPDVRQSALTRHVIDCFLQAELEANDSSIGPDADRYALIRRLSFDLTGLPPSVAEIEEFVADTSVDAVERLVDRYLASPHYGERFGKVWLDAAGYADSNGYFNADSDRPLAFQYRDYVIRSFNADKPFNRFVREQLAGDELIGWSPQVEVTPDVIDALMATHYLRNAQDGTGESDGNPDEVRADRYYTVEGTMQIVSTSLLGLTIQCAKCHEHKFEPIPHKEYYQFQAVFGGVYHHENWSKPNDRFVLAPLPTVKAQWEAKVSAAEQAVNVAKAQLSDWMASHRVRGRVLWQDSFDGSPESLADRWSDTAPGDDGPAGDPPVSLNSDQSPAARIHHGQLQIIESGTGGDRWLVTKQRFDWTPDQIGESIQVTFDLVDRRIDPNGVPAIRHGYYLAAHDHNDNGSINGGNVLIDGDPTESTTVYIDYPGKDGMPIGPIGVTPYSAGRNYGVRITHADDGKFILAHIVDGLPEENALWLNEDQLPDGAFGFELCCGRSYIVDNIVVESLDRPQDNDALTKYQQGIQPYQQALAAANREYQTVQDQPPGKIAVAVDLTSTPPPVQWLNRGDYGSPHEPVDAGPFSALTDEENPWEISPTSNSTGRRLAWANWVLRPNSRASALLARVQANRVWQHHFGFGIVATSDNFGLSGSPPTHPALLDWLAGELIRCDWSIKSLHRRIVSSQAYRQTSQISQDRDAGAADRQRYARYPIRRLDSEAIRDSFLQQSGELDDRMFGPYVKTDRTSNGEVVVSDDTQGARRRSIYLNQRRTQVMSMLQTFDSPTIVFNSVRRIPTTIPLQSLVLLNSPFVVDRSAELTNRLLNEPTSDQQRLYSVILQIWGRPVTDPELSAALEFLQRQTAERGGTSEARHQAWQDLNQMLFAASAALYLE